ncbi:MAG TPA: hypothetical protein VN915_16710 [Elusimicrobiota bacterium]|nr:hypothetical protein [Elusimicrobiota bacterium]
MRHALAVAVLISPLAARAAVLTAPVVPSAPAALAAPAAASAVFSPAALSVSALAAAPISAPALAPTAALAAPTLATPAAIPAAAAVSAVPAAPALPALRALAAPADGPAAPAPADAGRLAFDGAAKAAAADSPAPVPAPEIQPEAVRAALAASLSTFVGPAVLGWHAPHVEKPSFPYQVQKQRGIWAPQAVAQIRENRARVSAMLPSLSAPLLLELKTRGGATAAAAPDLATQSLFTSLLLRAAASGNIFTGYGTIVNVGWGSGDHVNVNGDVPVGGNSVANSLAAATARILYSDPTYAPIRAWLNAR